MNFLTKPSTWRNWELWIFKAAVFCFGIFLGILFSKNLSPYIPYFFLFAVCGTLLVLSMWVRKISSRQN